MSGPDDIAEMKVDRQYRVNETGSIFRYLGCQDNKDYILWSGAQIWTYRPKGFFKKFNLTEV